MFRGRWVDLQQVSEQPTFGRKVARVARKSSQNPLYHRELLNGPAPLLKACSLATNAPHEQRLVSVAFVADWPAALSQQWSRNCRMNCGKCTRASSSCRAYTADPRGFARLLSNSGVIVRRGGYTTRNHPFGRSRGLAASIN